MVWLTNTQHFELSFNPPHILPLEILALATFANASSLVYLRIHSAHNSTPTFWVFPTLPTLSHLRIHAFTFPPHTLSAPKPYHTIAPTL
ncbi:hypothetical protein CQA49_00110 [Helicobacter sp. MIT 00-7814]|nr:hypothetical protein CQA49_00110 [Helicobacter sp. MIT 00-7814]RDU57659.1 hypothetical protein CQA37_00110 [Helicobacter sp. MIT 99-10781]